MSSTEVARYEFELLERRVKALEEQRWKDLEERRRRSERRSNYAMATVIASSWAVILVVWTVIITLEVTGS